MTAIPPRQHSTQAAIFRAYEERADEDHRPHLGASIAGEACERKLFLAFRWAKREQFDGRLLRLFETGKLQEARLVADLRAIGCEVSEGPEDGAQWSFSELGGHSGGSMDAAVRGLPEAPASWHVAEFKTSNDRAFKDLAKKGVKAAKPLHYAQMMLYMGWSGMERAVYICCNKNTDDLHVERVEFERAEFEALMRKLERVIRATEPPPKIADKADAIECKYCPFAPLCHGAEIPAANCRTCCHSTPEMDGGARWSCGHIAKDLPLESQRTGCHEHRYIPPLVSNVMALANYREDNRVVWAVKGAGEVMQPPWESREIMLAVNAGTPETLVDQFVNEVKEEMGATLESVDPHFGDMKSDTPWKEKAA